jgi:hypothetical protein
MFNNNMAKIVPQALAVSKKRKDEDNRSTFTFKIEYDIMKMFKLLAVEKDITLSELIKESIIQTLKENKKL